MTASSRRPEVEALAAELGCSLAAAHDVLYLRSRSRWSAPLEQQLLDDHQAGRSVNICNYGCTTETGQELLQQAQRFLEER